MLSSIRICHYRNQVSLIKLSDFCTRNSTFSVSFKTDVLLLTSRETSSLFLSHPLIPSSQGLYLKLLVLGSLYHNSLLIFPLFLFLLLLCNQNSFFPKCWSPKLLVVDRKKFKTLNSVIFQIWICFTLWYIPFIPTSFTILIVAPITGFPCSAFVRFLSHCNSTPLRMVLSFLF